MEGGQTPMRKTSPPAFDKWSRRVTAAIVATVVVSLGVVAIAITTGKSPISTSTTTTTIPPLLYPVGIVNHAEPSGMSPPSATALWGYKLVYATDFSSSVIPAGWDVYNGFPGGDPGAKFGANHVVVRNGQLLLETYRDQSFHDHWVTGGLCQCGLSQTYGAYFVRSRITGPGPNEIELLWPKSNNWPPEVDFNESSFVMGTMSTVHWSLANHIEQHFDPNVNQTQWHTWGVIWEPNRIVYTVDGREWAAITSAARVPNVPMTLDIEQTTKCPVKAQCPSSPETLHVDWVVVYSQR